MKIIGICSKSIEQLKPLIYEESNNTDIQLYTVYEFLNLDYDKNKFKDSRIILVDSIAKLLTVNDLVILDAEYFNQCWRIHRDIISRINILEALNKTNMEDISFQYEIRQDYNLEDYTFITHMTEFNKSPYIFCKKIHNLLTKTSKEFIDCSDEYKNLLKEKLINKDMAILYSEFLEKKKRDYPTLFKYMKFTIESNYAEKDAKGVKEDEGAE